MIGPEDAVPLVPTDGGVLTIDVPARFPLIAVAQSAKPDAGMERALIWGPQMPERTWLYQVTELLFLSIKGGGVIELSIERDELQAKGRTRIKRFPWPVHARSWSLKDLGGRPRTRRMLLTEYFGSGCPTTVVDHWLELRDGNVTELLTTRYTGEGGGEETSFEGTSAVWPLSDGGAAGTGELRSPVRFPPIDDVPLNQRVVVYEEVVERSRLCRAGRSIYLDGDQGLRLVRREQLDGGDCEQAQ